MPERSRPALLTRRVATWTIGWVLAAALYLLLIDITDLPELIVGAGAAALAATGLDLAREQGAGQRIRGGWLLRIYRPILRVPLDIVIVSLMALRAIADRRARHGTFRALPFAGGGPQQLAGGRRALAEGFGSLAPNTFVIGIDEEQELILAHQLRRMPSRKTIDVLDLG